MLGKRVSMFRIMASQSKISSFFKSPSSATKRTIPSDSLNAKKTVHSATDKEFPEPKKPKMNKENDENELQLSGNDKRRIEENRISAKLKLLSSQTQGVVANVGTSWFPALEAQFNKDYFKEVKVVILGQDPYHGPSQAHGLCFSVLPGIRPPPSLVNMFKELEQDIDGFKKPSHGNLIGWASQGVLLLNACLTVRAGQPNSHAGKGWEKLTDAVIHWLNSNTKGIVFMLWGSYAQKKGSFIDQRALK